MPNSARRMVTFETSPTGFKEFQRYEYQPCEQEAD
jgi:hypothetical protein